MDTTSLRNIFREEFRDNVEPYLVSDLLVYTYIDAAQKMFCRLTSGIEDATSFKITLQPGVDTYTLDPRILKLRKAVDAGNGREIPLIAEERADAYGVRFDGVPGQAKAVVTGATRGKVRVWPVPDADAIVALPVIRLEVFRLPSPVASGDDLEIDEQHHLYLLDWIKHLAYNNQDVDVSDGRKAQDCEARFRGYCKQAADEASRARHTTGTVQYGGL